MLLKDVRFFFSDKRRNPDCRFKPALSDLLQNTLDVAAEGRTSFQPVTHGRLVAIVDLNVTKSGSVFRDEVEIIQHLSRCYARTEAIP
jgi:hypothetical protein